MGRRINKRHEQHTRGFRAEMNKIQNNSFKAFRNSDEVWIIGKYKGSKLSKTPLSYLRWVLKTINLSINDRVTLQNIVAKKVLK